MYETYIGETIGDHNHGFKTRMNCHVTESRRRGSTFKFPVYFFNWIKRNKRELEKAFSYYTPCSP